MGLRGVIETTTDPLSRLASTVRGLGEEVGRLRSIVRRDCMKARGYELQRRELPTPGLYLVNVNDSDPNFGAATLLGP